MDTVDTIEVKLEHLTPLRGSLMCPQRTTFPSNISKM